jgi:hypothetical protein
VTEPAWRPIADAPEGETVETGIFDERSPKGRNLGKLARRGRLWFVPDFSMYVYYTPTHWRPISGEVAS